jgi:hypothetical protein
MPPDNPDMKVLDLQCAKQHAFEGWFGSEDDFQRQLAQGLVECPYCGEREVSKKLSAPRLNLGAVEPVANQTQAVVSVPNDEARQQVVQLAWLAMVREVLEKTEDVGPRFVEEARRIHYGETPQRGIRGQATQAETEALLEEGISVMPLPLPHALKGPVQ